MFNDFSFISNDDLIHNLMNDDQFFYKRSNPLGDDFEIFSQNMDLDKLSYFDDMKNVIVAKSKPSCSVTGTGINSDDYKDLFKNFNDKSTKVGSSATVISKCKSSYETQQKVLLQKKCVFKTEKTKRDRDNNISKQDRNKLAAKRCRENKKQYMDFLATKLKNTENELNQYKDIFKRMVIYKSNP
jgi:hypothetical protein